MSLERSWPSPTSAPRWHSWPASLRQPPVAQLQRPNRDGMHIRIGEPGGQQFQESSSEGLGRLFPSPPLRSSHFAFHPLMLYGRSRPDPAVLQRSRTLQNRPFGPVCLHVLAGPIGQRPKKSIETNFRKAKPAPGVTMRRSTASPLIFVFETTVRRCGGPEPAERFVHDIRGQGCDTSQVARLRSTCKAKPDAPGSPNSGRNSKLGTR